MPIINAAITTNFLTLFLYVEFAGNNPIIWNIRDRFEEQNLVEVFDAELKFPQNRISN